MPRGVLAPEGASGGTRTSAFGACGELHPGFIPGMDARGAGAADHVEGRVTRGLSLGRLRAPAFMGRELPMPVCARKATGTALAAPHATKALKPLELRCPVQRRH